MLHVVTTNNTEVFRHLGARALQSAGVNHLIATDFDSALDLIRTTMPQVAIIDAELPGGDGYALCKAVKSDPATEAVCVVLVLDSIVTREQLDRLEHCGCDDVLALPIASDEFHQHIVRAAGLPYRRNARVIVDVNATITRGVEQARLLDQLAASGPDDRPAPMQGRCLDLSITGAGVWIDGAVRAREQVLVTLEHGGATLPPMLASVAWTRADESGTRAGLTFTEVPIEARLLIEQMCLYDIRRLDSGGVSVELRGEFTEGVDFSALAEQLAREDEIEFQTREVRYLSSVGVRLWCALMRTLAGKTIRFRQLSLAFAAQIAMVPLAGGDAEIVSFEAPYFCEGCDAEEIRLLEVGALLRQDTSITPPTLTCNRCKGELVFDDMPERYFSFLAAGKHT